jgi:nitrate reductase beta subunit
VDAASVADARLVEAQRSLILDPRDPAVLAAASQSGVPASVLDAAQVSPVYRFVKEWALALPLHPEYRTLPTVFYVPPLSPVLASMRDGAYENADAPFFDADSARLPLRFLAALFGAGQEAPVRYALRKQQAVRAYRRSVTVGDVGRATAQRRLAEADSSAEQAEAIYRLTSLPRVSDRFVLPPGGRESAIEKLEDPLEHKRRAGFGFVARSEDGP